MESELQQSLEQNGQLTGRLHRAEREASALTAQVCCSASGLSLIPQGVAAALTLHLWLLADRQPKAFTQAGAGQRQAGLCSLQRRHGEGEGRTAGTGGRYGDTRAQLGFRDLWGHFIDFHSFSTTFLLPYP